MALDMLPNTNRNKHPLENYGVQEVFPSGLHGFPHLTLTKIQAVGTIIISIFQIKKITYYT